MAENLGRFFRCSNSAMTCNCVTHFPRIFLLISYQCYFLSVCNIPCANNNHVHCCSITRRFLNFLYMALCFYSHPTHPPLPAPSEDDTKRIISIRVCVSLVLWAWSPCRPEHELEEWITQHLLLGFDVDEQGLYWMLVDIWGHVASCSAETHSFSVAVSRSLLCGNKRKDTSQPGGSITDPETARCACAHVWVCEYRCARELSQWKYAFIT